MASSSESEIEAEIKRQIPQEKPKIENELLKLARDGVAYAKSIAPVHDPQTAKNKKRKPGTFRDAFRAVAIKDYKGMPAAQIVNDDPVSQFIEYGTEDTPEHAVLAKTAVQIHEAAKEDIVVK